MCGGEEGERDQGKDADEWMLRWKYGLMNGCMEGGEDRGRQGGKDEDGWMEGGREGRMGGMNEGTDGV